jgi:hypothetical protein
LRTSIPFADVAAFVESLGPSLDDTASVLIKPDVITVTQYRRNAAGQRFAVGDRVATVATEIRIERGA